MNYNIEGIVYVLGLSAFVCVCICVYNIFVLCRRWTSTRRNRRVAAEIRTILQRAIDCLPEGGKPDRRDAVRLSRILGRSESLIVFTNIFQEMQGTPGADRIPAMYLNVLKHLTVLYKNRSDPERIFLAYAYSVFGVGAAELTAFMLQSLRSHNMYLRIQALKTLCIFGDVQPMVDAIQQVDAGDEMLFSNRLISDTLVGFRGDADQLNTAIFHRFSSFSVPIQVAFIDSLTTRKSGNLARELAQLLQNDRTDMEVQIALLKYFREVYCEEALSPILDMTRHPAWECVAIAAKTLQNYPNLRSISTVRRLLSDRNWFVRLNSAMTLVAIAPDTSYYEDVNEDGDPYAKDILNYAIEQLRLG